MIPDPKPDTRFAVVEDLLLLWNNVKLELVKIQATAAPLLESERALRDQIMGLAFPMLTEECRKYMEANDTDDHAPSCTCGKEGTNTLKLPAKFQLKGTIKIDRKVDEAALEASKKALQDLQFNPDTVFRVKTELEVKAYKALPKEARKVVDQALIIKPAAPTLEIVGPKE